MEDFCQNGQEKSGIYLFVEVEGRAGDIILCFRLSLVWLQFGDGS
jgi:hypothetical protein